jgi:hypothetical protein
MNREEAERFLYKEEDRRNTILHDLSFAVTLLGILVGVMYFYISSYLYNVSSAIVLSSLGMWMQYTFLVLLGFGIIQMVIAVVLIIIVFANNIYYYYPKAQELYDYYLSILDFHNGDECEAKKDYDTELMKRAIEAKDYNQDINQIRKKYTQWAIRTLFGAFLTLFLALIPFLFVPKDMSSSVRIEAINDTLYTSEMGEITHRFVFDIGGNEDE